jgi:hypothetical protein
LVLVLLGLQAACATSYPLGRTLTGTRGWRHAGGAHAAAAAESDASGENMVLANLRRAATLPWTDGGRCVVQESSEPWPVLAERCYQVLDHERVRFKDRTGRCAIASADAAALGVGLCVLAAPETKPAQQEPQLKRRPKPEPVGQDWPPPPLPEPLERERRPECQPIPVPHSGGDKAHNTCADWYPPNRYPGMDARVEGKNFDALQVGVRVLWEVKMGMRSGSE